MAAAGETGADRRLGEDLHRVEDLAAVVAGLRRLVVVLPSDAGLRDVEDVLLPAVGLRRRDVAHNRRADVLLLAVVVVLLPDAPGLRLKEGDTLLHPAPTPPVNKIQEVL